MLASRVDVARASRDHVLRSHLGGRGAFFLVRLWLERDGADVVVRAAQAKVNRPAAHPATPRAAHAL
ncbi:MAG: hypothetical protein M3Y87_11420 [Myxococcota bacterium]|nr:hypothetical protein [Myxococcota bacterium]